MRFTEHELTLAVTAAAKTVAHAQSSSLLGRAKQAARAQSAGSGDADQVEEIEQVWNSLTKLQRYHLLEPVGSQILPVLLALPDVEVAPGTRPTFTDAQIVTAVEETLGETGGGRLRRKATVLGRAALVKTAIESLPPRRDPDGLLSSDDFTVPDDLSGLD